MFVALAVRKQKQQKYEKSWFPSGSIEPAFGDSREDVAREVQEQIDRRGAYDYYDYEVWVGEITHKVVPPKAPINLVPFTEEKK